MMPSINPGTEVLIEPVEATPQTGDILLINHPDGFFAHRLVQPPDRGPGGKMLTRGDACPQNDPPLHTGQAIGMVKTSNHISPKQFLIRLLQQELDATGEPDGIAVLIRKGNPGDRFWEILYSISHAEGLEIFTHRKLFELDLSDRVPLHVATWAEQRYALHLVKTARILEAYHILSNTFSREGIVFVPLKGTALCLATDNRPVDRPFNDMDVLVRRDQVSRCVKLAEQSGYRQDPYRSRRGLEPAMLLQHHLPPFRKGHLVLELHYNLLPGGSARFTDSFLSSAHRVAGSGLLPDPYYHAVFLAAHLEKHALEGQFQYRLLRDLAQILGHKEEKWSEARRLADDFGLGGSMMKARICFDSLYSHGLPPDITGIYYPTVKQPMILLVTELARLKGIRLKMLWLMDYLFPSSQFIRRFYPGRHGAGIVAYHGNRLMRGIRKTLF